MANVSILAIKNAALIKELYNDVRFFTARDHGEDVSYMLTGADNTPFSAFHALEVFSDIDPEYLENNTYTINEPQTTLGYVNDRYSASVDNLKIMMGDAVTFSVEKAAPEKGKPRSDTKELPNIKVKLDHPKLQAILTAQLKQLHADMGDHFKQEALQFADAACDYLTPQERTQFLAEMTAKINGTAPEGPKAAKLTVDYGNLQHRKGIGE